MHRDTAIFKHLVFSTALVITVNTYFRTIRMLKEYHCLYPTMYFEGKLSLPYPIYIGKLRLRQIKQFSKTMLKASWVESPHSSLATSFPEWSQWIKVLSANLLATRTSWCQRQRKAINRKCFQTGSSILQKRQCFNGRTVVRTEAVTTSSHVEKAQGFPSTLLKFKLPTFWSA